MNFYALSVPWWVPDRVGVQWLKVHSTFGWYEMYEQKPNDDLQRFVDRYCKDIMNGWEHDTPPARLSLHGRGSLPNIVERTGSEFPLRRRQLKPYYLEAATKTIHDTPREGVSFVFRESRGFQPT